MTESKENTAKTVADLVRSMDAANILELSDGETTVKVLEYSKGKDGGREIASIQGFLDQVRERPRRLKGTASFSELASFCAYANRFKDPSSSIFADIDSCQLTAIFDHHEKFGAPRHGQHRAVYKAPPSDEWTLWGEINDTEMSQADLANFLEDALLDVCVVDGSERFNDVRELSQKLGTKIADPATLLSLSRGLSVTVECVVTNQINPGTGEASLVFSESHHEGAKQQPLKVPGLFVLDIPVFRAGARHYVAARLRYRVVRQAITWKIQLMRSDVVLAEAFSAVCSEAIQKTELPLFHGTPEK